MTQQPDAFSQCPEGLKRTISIVGQGEEIRMERICFLMSHTRDHGEASYLAKMAGASSSTV
jgi:hypothetical protein